MATNGRDISRAERFEDEKRRIIESCFSKPGEDGSVVETYITHIRIIEYSSYPNSPPPPEARSPHAEKHRVIIVAVRKSGRVRVHKSKENPNGTFSIGKTWDLNELTAIESFTAPSTNPELRQWAGNVGFLITLGKSYYWQAQIDKEKKFFIASLIKIYGKYSGGKVPQLAGFDEYELDQILHGASSAQRRAPPPLQPSLQPPLQLPPLQPPPAQAPPTPPAAAARGARAPVPIPIPSAPRDRSEPPPPLPPPSGRATPAGSNYGSLGGAPGDYRNPRSAMLVNGSTASPATSIDSSRSANQTVLRRLAGSNKSQESVAASMTARSDDGTSSLPPRSRNGPTNAATANGLGGSGSGSGGGGYGGLADSPAITENKPPPERKRPPMDPSLPQGMVDDGLVPAPLMSSTRSRDGIVPPPRSSNRSSPLVDSTAAGNTNNASMVPPPLLRSPPSNNQGNGSRAASATATTTPPPPSSSGGETAPRVTPPSPATTAATTAETEPTAAPEPIPVPVPVSVSAATPTSPEDTRPGLGPMIKKKSKGEVANAFWKAATAANAFKPRPGGAGERLRQAAQNKNVDGPDGITSVVPAPPRPVSVDKKPAEEEAAAAAAAAAAVAAAAATAAQKPPPTPPRSSVRSIPEVKITVPNANRPVSVQSSTTKDVGATAAVAATAAAATDGVQIVTPPIDETGRLSSSRKLVVAGNDAKYLSALGMDPTLMDKRGVEFAQWLDYFGWVPGAAGMRTVNMDDLKIDMDRELGRAQAGGWLARFQEDDERVEAIKRGIDQAMDECEELDNLLTLYSVELSTLSDDIAFIETQGQGLQVQAANQKLLKKELESLLATCAITAADLAALRSAPLDTDRGIEDIEATLVTLFRAMSKIDPGMMGGRAAAEASVAGIEGGGGGGGSDAATAAAQAQLEGTVVRLRRGGGDGTDGTAGLNSDFSQMRIVREKKEMYLAESDAFVRRLVVFMAGEIDRAVAQTRRAMEGALAKKGDPRNHEAGRALLWRYSVLLLYAREADAANWDRILQVYEDRTGAVYKLACRDVVAVWKKNARRAGDYDGGSGGEVLFTALQEKKDEGLATTARKLTVKRSQTLARSLRSPLGGGGGSDNHSHGNSRSPASAGGGGGGNDSRRHAYEVFASVLDELLPLVLMEQNFVVDLFHATTLQVADFADVVAAAARPGERRGGYGDLRRVRAMEPDRALARRVALAMEALFGFLEADLQALVDWVLSLEALQGVGVLATLERRLAELSRTSQEFAHNALQRLHGSLEGRFHRFVDEQIRAIEETKVKIKKRKGVIGFMRVFPNFAAAVENMMAEALSAAAASGGSGSGSGSHGSSNLLPVRRTVDAAYDRILRSMFDSLKVIARENPAMMTGGAAAAAGTSTTAAAAASGGGSGADPEDKEALNFHILLIENMNHYLEDVDTGGGAGSAYGRNAVLEAWRGVAAAELGEHLGLYLGAVMRRPLGRLLEHLENVEAQLAAGKAAAAVAAQPSNSKATFNKVLGSYDAREVRKGIETLRKRVEKHFSPVDAAAAAAAADGGMVNSSGIADDATNHRLVARVLRECEAFYGDVEQRIGRITTEVYGGDVLYEWPRAEVKAGFAGGAR